MDALTRPPASPSPAKSKVKKSPKRTPKRKSQRDPPPLAMDSSDRPTGQTFDEVEDDIPADAAAFLAEVMAFTPRARATTPRKLELPPPMSPPSPTGAMTGRDGMNTWRKQAPTYSPPPKSKTPRQTTAAAESRALPAPVKTADDLSEASTFRELFAQISDGDGTARLKHVDHANDRSAPFIDENTHLRPAPLKPDLFAQISDGGGTARLKHVDHANDRSAPFIDENTHLRPAPLKPDLFAQISDGGGTARLKHVDHANDRSAPLIDENTRIRPSAHKALIGEIKSKSRIIGAFVHRKTHMQNSQDTLAMISNNSVERLRHVDRVDDRSSPCIEPGVGLKKSNFGQLFAQISAGEGTQKLKHVEAANDRSRPVIEAHISIRKDVRPNLLAEIQKKFADLTTYV